MSWFRVATGCERETINAAALRFLPNKRDADLQNWGCECFCSTAAATMSIFDVYPRSFFWPSSPLATVFPTSPSALSHSPTYISHPTAECISVAMATQSGAPRFPGEASHSWTLYCVSSNSEGLRTSARLSSRAVRERVCDRAQECRTGCRQKIPEPMSKTHPEVAVAVA